ncbi:hypothetical protein C8R43DRAFT_42551 [Mycena crocata]|nr:hypothetical protein C8R43DRAFT_42551 [Mycena crocata]
MRNAANPCLNIGGLGTAGLPLSDRDARAIVSLCVPAYNSASGVWEMSAEKITSLRGQDGPIFTLRKLVIHESGSQQLDFRDQAGPSGEKVANLMVVLPSLFSGGHDDLRHDFQSKSLDLGYQSGIHTSTVAAYRGVWHSASSVVSGHRLALLYDIDQLFANPPIPEH